MDLNPSQIIFQLGIAGLIVWVGYRFGIRAIDRWGEIEREKTAAIADGFRSIVATVNAHSTADVASHVKLAESHGELRESVVRVEGKIDAAFDWRERTPVEGVPRIAVPRTITPQRQTAPRGLYIQKRPGTKDDK